MSKILSQRKSFEVVGKEKPAGVRMARENDAKQLRGLPLVPLGRAEQV
jgi:hypothetical protein